MSFSLGYSVANHDKCRGKEYTKHLLSIGTVLACVYKETGLNLGNIKMSAVVFFVNARFESC